MVVALQLELPSVHIGELGLVDNVSECAIEVPIIDEHKLLRVVIDECAPKLPRRQEHEGYVDQEHLPQLLRVVVLYDV